jgi:hypothetical protein
MLQQNKDISGIYIGDKEVKILQMADDTTILTSNMDDIPKILDLLKTFQSISGLKTNIDKTLAYQIGCPSQLDLTVRHHDLHWKELPISLLGITITDNLDTNMKENFTSKLESIDILTKIWSGRSLSMKGKLTIINSILIPKLIYPSTILDVPPEVINKAKELIRTFFWNWKRPKIKLDMLVRKIEEGGIKYPCMDCKIKS